MPWDRAKRVNDGVLTADKVFSGEQEYNELVGKLIEITQHLPDFSKMGGHFSKQGLSREGLDAAKKEYITRLEGLLSEVRTSLALKERKLSLKLEDYEWKSRSLERCKQTDLWKTWTGTNASEFAKEFGAAMLAKPNDPPEKLTPQGMVLMGLGCIVKCLGCACQMISETAEQEANKEKGVAPQKPSHKYDYAHLKFVLSWPASGALSAPQQNQMDRL